MAVKWVSNAQEQKDHSWREKLLMQDIYDKQLLMYRTMCCNAADSPVLPEIKNVIFHNPATIVFWSDGTKTVVKCQYDDVYDREKGLAMAICKKVFGNKGNYCNQLKKWLPKVEDKSCAYEVHPLWDEIAEAFREAGEAVAGNRIV